MMLMCSPVLPSLSSFDVGPEEIPREGVIAVFTGEQGSPYLPIGFTVRDASSTLVAGEVEQYVGSATTGDLVLWRADASLTSGETYSITIDYVNGSRTLVRTAATASAAEPGAPVIALAELRELARTVESCCDSSACGGCLTREYEYIPGLVVSWHEPAAGLDRRYLRYRWLVQQPDGSFGGANGQGTTLDTAPQTTELFVSEPRDSYCIKLEARSLITDATAESEAICLASSELVTVPHAQPEPFDCPWEDEDGDGSSIGDDVDGGCSTSGHASLLPLLALVALRRRRR